MLKTVSSVTNAIGALNYKGTWNASTNTPTITSSVGVKGDYYQVSVAGSTTINGISNWGVGDVIAFNGTTWQRIEGGADLNGVNLSVSGTTTLSGLTASTSLALDANKNVVSVTNTGTGNNVLGTSPSIATPTLTGDVQMSTGNLVVGTAGKGIDFSATPGTGTSELLADYEEGTWTPTLLGSTGNPTQSYLTSATVGRYTKVGNVVTISFRVHMASSGISGGTGTAQIGGLPFASVNVNNLIQGGSISTSSSWATTNTGAPTNMALNNNSTTLLDLYTYQNDASKVAGVTATNAADVTNSTNVAGTITYIAA